MNCKNCGGPVGWDGTHNIVMCEYCGSVSPPPSSEDGEDRTVPLAISGDSQCPRCHEQLAKSALDKALVEQCGECGGMLMTNGVFGSVVRHRRSTFRGTESRPTPLNAELLKLNLSCPRCDERMEVHPYYGPGNTVIDSCAACGLVWLDRGEMAAIERAPGRR